MRRTMPLEKFVACRDHQELRLVAPEVAEMLVEWWNVSRFHKHGSAAAWSEIAFCFSVRRVAKLPPWQQLALAEAGVEYGWQALKPEYIKDASAPATGGLAPKSTAMKEAIDRWHQQPV
jgi:hypothetical protein